MAAPPLIGIDLGGTKIEGVVIRGAPPTLEIVTRKRIPTEQERGFEHILGRFADLILALEQETGHAPGSCPVGVGMPGSVTEKGLVKNSNTVCLNDTAFRRDLCTRLQRQVRFSNDANCFALAEALLGAGQNYPLVFGVIIGTGVGGGIVINGEAREGPQSVAGEWGHTVIEPSSDRACYCGLSGCVETYLSGPAVEAHYRRLSGRTLHLPQILDEPATNVARAQCIETWLDAFGRALAGVINVLDPDAVILGGGVSNANLLYSEGVQRVARYVFNDRLTTPILRHHLGDSAGVLGAALIANEEESK